MTSNIKFCRLNSGLVCLFVSVLIDLCVDKQVVFTEQFSHGVATIIPALFTSSQISAVISHSPSVNTGTAGLYSCVQSSPDIRIKCSDKPILDSVEIRNNLIRAVHNMKVVRWYVAPFASSQFMQVVEVWMPPNACQPADTRKYCCCLPAILCYHSSLS